MDLADAVSFVGVGVAAIGVLGVAAPARLTALLARWRVLTRLPVTLGLRILTGILFLAAALDCRLPELVRLIGVLELLGAALLLVLGAQRLDRFVTWWLERPPSFVRKWCVAASAFGLLIVYAG